MDHTNKADDSSQKPDKTSEKLAKDSPEADARAYRAAISANPNKRNTVSPDGQSRFCLTDESQDKKQKEPEKLAQGYGIDYSLERARQKAQEASHKRFDGKDARNNDEFLDMFLNGSGNDRQLHTKRGDPVLEDFIKSPGVQAMRDQYLKLGCPAETSKLSYGTKEAFLDTVAKPFGDSAGHLFTDLFDEKHLGSVGTQVGGFGNPPKEYPWATANATRCNAEGKPDGNGEFVQFQVTNVAGAHSWGLHAVSDRPLGSSGPYRSIIQVFSWTEPIPHKTNEKK